MTVQVVLNEYLSRLRQEQQNRPIRERLIVPSIKELAGHSGVSRTAFSDFAHGKNERISSRLIDTSIKVLREYGHDTQLTDIITYIPDEVKG